jgi:hypothetical protein
MSVSSQKARKDPILDRLVTEPEPPVDAVLKDIPTDESPSGAPSAGESAVREISLRNPVSLLRVLGPGLITGASDDDPSGIGTYSQVGSQFGFGLLWTALFTFPLILAVQEMCARIALHTGVGLGVSLRRKLPTWLVGICRRLSSTAWSPRRSWCSSSCSLQTGLLCRTG